MKFIIKNDHLEKNRSACVVVGVFELCKLSVSAKKLDKISNYYISSLLQCGDLEGKMGQKLLLHNVPNVLSDRILLIGCGKECDCDEHQYKKIIHTMINSLTKTASTEAICFLTELNIKNRNIYWKVRQAVEIIQENLYDFNQLKSKKIELHRQLDKIIFNVSTHSELNNGERAIQHGLAIAQGIKAAKDLSNLPPNICNTTYLASQARQLSNIYSNKNMTYFVINEQQMKTLGMNAYLAVGQGTHSESLMSVIQYKGAVDTEARPIVLIGKGVTFDTGGISLKPEKEMDEMKYDMCGAASVYGIMLVAAELNLPLNIVGILAGCENMPSGLAYRPGDIITTMSGKTVEVLNTDAEGRLILCDTLTYVERFNPEVVIDIATLTGACVVALGNNISGLMSNYHPLVQDLIVASEQSGDRAWNLPIADEYQEQLDSNFADMTNIGGRSAGAITAACFLSRFTKKYHWAHIDIAGTAWRSGKNKGATGRPIALLSQFLLNRSNVNNTDK